MIQLPRYYSIIIGAILLFSPAQPLSAEEIRVAASTNFRNTGRMLAEQFNAANSDQVVMIFGASGKQYAEISQGASFDIFLSADAERPQKLEAEGHAISGTRFTYAIGTLVLWSSKAGLADSQGAILQQRNFAKLAMANPKNTPFGVAARQVLQSLELEETLKEKIVLTRNIDQAFQLVSSSKVDLGFVSSAQLAQSIWGSQGSRWNVPVSLHEPIQQQAILISDKPAARKFLASLSSPAARQLIQSHGYILP